LGDIFILNTPLDIGESAAHILNISFPPLNGEPLDGEMLLLNMDMEGVCISSGSACTSGAVEPSHVLRAMNIPEATADATIRFSLGKDNTVEDIDQAVKTLQKVLKRMRGHESKMA
jgi:cysteine desulfurase